MKVHVDQIPQKRNYAILREEFQNQIVDKLANMFKSASEISKKLGISLKSVQRLCYQKGGRITISDFLVIIDFLDLTLQEVESKIIWVGSNIGNGIPNPKLPFDFSTRAAARLLAACCNEGWISDGLYYSNSSKELRDSVRRDALSVFGGDENTIKEWVKDKDQYLSFTSVIRDVVQMITGFKGVKADNNPSVPSFILGNNELIFGWIEQTIADEGHVTSYIHKRRREIIWRRSFNKNLAVCKLNRDEQKMLDKIGIGYDVKNIGSYKTQLGKERIRLQTRISRRENIWKLRDLIKIPDSRKDKLFSEMIDSLARFKEPSKIRNATVKLCKKQGHVTSTDLMKEVNFKTNAGAIKWLRKYAQEGWLKCIEESYYGGDARKNPAKYILAEP